jgi:DNA-directed RNA polymerase specialized sigma subunit
MTDDKDKKKYDMEMTAQDVADEMGVSRQTIADIERRALKKIRKMLKAKFDKQDLLPD